MWWKRDREGTATRIANGVVSGMRRGCEVARLGACRVAGSRSCEIRGAEAASLVMWRPQTRRDASWATRDVAGGVGVRNASRGVVGVLGWQGGFACTTRDEAGGFRAVARRR